MSDAITKMFEGIVMQAKENQEEFIIETIQPYCENILQTIINKEELKQILLNGMQKQQPCEDCISREAIETAFYDLGLGDEENGAAEYMCGLWDAYEAIKSLPSVQPRTRWIPVSERLPEKQITIGKCVFSENVLGTEGYTIRRAYYNYTTKEWFDGNEEMEWTEITHWMPLPQAYREESGEE